MMWQAKLKAWAVGLGLTAATIGGTGYLATTGVGQGPPVSGAGAPPGGPPGGAVRAIEEDALKLQIMLFRAKVEADQQALKVAQEKLAAIKGQPAPAVTPMSAELRKLREERLEALKATLKGLDLNFQEGLTSFASNLTLSIELSQAIAEAEVGLAAVGAPKTGPWVAHRERAIALRVLTGTGVKDGFLTKASAHQARAAELAAEIRLLELGGK